MAAPRQSDRAFGLTFAALFAVITVVVRLVAGVWPGWPAALAAVLAAVALAAPWILLPFNRIWAKLAHRLGVATNFVLLGAFFFLVIWPFGIAMRLFGGDPMHRRPDADADSYWSPVKRQADAETLRDMF
jgi:hypothetical protein